MPAIKLAVAAVLCWAAAPSRAFRQPSIRTSNNGNTMDVEAPEVVLSAGDVRALADQIEMEGGEIKLTSSGSISFSDGFGNEMTVDTIKTEFQNLDQSIQSMKEETLTSIQTDIDTLDTELKEGLEQGLGGLTDRLENMMTCQSKGLLGPDADGKCSTASAYCPLPAIKAGGKVGNTYVEMASTAVQFEGMVKQDAEFFTFCASGFGYELPVGMETYPAKDFLASVDGKVSTALQRLLKQDTKGVIARCQPSKEICVTAGCSVRGLPKCDRCPAGHACEDSMIVPCPMHTYQNYQGKTICKPCPRGKSCPTEATVDPEDCPAGYKCELGKAPAPCGPGTRSNDKGDACIACDEGFYCTEPANAEQKQCHEDCKTCKDDKVCILCKNEDFVKDTVGCKSAYIYPNCRKWLDSGHPKAVAAMNSIKGTGDHKTVEWQFTTPKNNKVVKGHCLFMMEQRQSNKKKAYTLIKCDAFDGRCDHTSRCNEGNSCTRFGYYQGPYRSKQHYQRAKRDIPKWTSYRSVAPGVCKDSGGRCGCYYPHCCYMRSGGGCCGWRAVDNGEWWLRDSRYGEPNGDYGSRTWLSGGENGNEFHFNDLWGGYRSTTYMCMTGPNDE